MKCDEADKCSWAAWGGTVCWQCGPFSCSLTEHFPDDGRATIDIAWNDGQRDHRIEAARSITVADAKRQAAVWIMCKLAEWLAEADNQRTGQQGDARAIIHIALTLRANQLATSATTDNARHTGMADEFRATSERVAGLAKIFDV